MAIENLQMKWTRILLAATLIAFSQAQNVAQQVCSSSNMMAEYSVSDASIILGGLFDLRHKGTNGLGCGVLDSGNMQIFEATRYALNLLNNYKAVNTAYLSGIKFGLMAYDTCLSSTQAVSALESLFPQLVSSNSFCQLNSSLLVGLIGSLSSTTAKPAAEFAGQFGISVVSPAARDPALSNKSKYPTFARTVPSYSVFAKAVVELLVQLKWENVVIVYVTDDDGISGYQQLLQATYTRGLCISNAMPLDDSMNKATYKSALSSFGLSNAKVAIVIASSRQTQVILDAADEVLTNNDVQWVLSDLDITIDHSNRKQAHGALVVLPKFPRVSGFVNYMSQLLVSPTSVPGNPWFMEWYSSVNNCSLTIATNQCILKTRAQIDSTFVQSPWVVPAIKAVFAYAEAVRAACSNVGSVCPNLKAMSPAAFSALLRNVDFSFPGDFPAAELAGHKIKFDLNGDPIISYYSILNYNNRGGNAFTFQEIGTFISDVLNISTTPSFYDTAKTTILTSNPTATCADLGCQNCILPQRDVVFSYKPADIVIATLGQAHVSGRTPFTCGAGIVPQLSNLVAAEWAVSTYKANNPGKLNGVSLGSLVADICPGSFVAEGFLTDLLSGNNRLVDSSGAVVTPETIYALVGLTGSDVTKTVSPILSSYKIPDVEISATTPDVTTGGTTPFFSRAVPNNEIYYRAVASLLLNLGWKYVQVASHSSGMYYEMTQLFIKTAASYGVCVVNVADQFDESNYRGMLDELLSIEESQVVVVIGGMDDVRGLLGAINTKGVSGRLQLVAGSGSWALNPEYVQGLESAAANAIVLDLEMEANANFNANLIRLFSSTDRADILANPFLRELFEINKCSLVVSTRGLYSRTCTAADTNANLYQGRTPFVIQSIYTLADKLHEVIVEVCNTTSYTGLCSNFLSAPDIGQRLQSKLQNVGPLSNGYGVKNWEGVTEYAFYVYRQGYTKFGKFNTDTRQLSSLSVNTLGNYQSSCSGVCLECEYLFNLQGRFFTPGDMLIAGAFSISDPGPVALQPYICGSTRLTNGPQYTMAMFFALNQVNSGQARVSVPGVTFGGLALDHCNNPGRAKLMASSIYSGFMTNGGVDQSKILAWMTDNTASTNETATILDPLGVAIVSPSATSDRLTEYPNFYRTIQGDRTAALAMVKIVKTYGYPYIQVVYGDSDYGVGGLEVMTTVSRSEGICITYSHKLSANNSASSIVSSVLTKGTDVVVLFLGTADTEAFLTAVTNVDAARKKLLILMPEPYTKAVKTAAPSLTRPIISLRLQRSVVAKYQNYINSLPLSNPYFQRYYMALKKCNLPGYSTYSTPCPTPLTSVTSDVNYAEDNYILPTINSVYAIVNALHLTIMDYCRQGYKSPCNQFYTAQDRLQRFNRHLGDVSFIDEGQNSFQFTEREGNTVFEILQSTVTGDYKKIGSYAGITLEILDSSLYTYSNVTSTCVEDSCLACASAGFNFSYIPGDVYLAGVFDVHQRSLSPFTCGAVNPLHGYLLLEAFHFAVNKVNEKQGQFANILRGTKLGGIGLDACNSQVLGSYVVSSINSGYTSLVKNGVVVSPGKIDAYIGSYSSKASIYLAKILTDLKIPQISYAAGSEDLNDKRVYPFFYRTVPSDGDQVDAMLSFLDRMDIRYIQILYEDNSNGDSAKNYLIEKAAAYRICVAQTVAFPDLGVINQETSNGIVSKLIQKPAANTVVTFLSIEFINSLLLAVQRSSAAVGKLRFVGSSAWADSQDAILRAETNAVGSFTVKLDSNDVYEFESYMGAKNLVNSVENPWFEEYYQYLLKCYTSKTHTMGYTRQCSSAPTSIINTEAYQQDPGVVYVINAVYAAAFALHETLKEKCGPDYTAVCQAYRNNADRRVRLRDNLANVTFDDPLGRKFVFRNRSGVAGYKFNSVVRKGTLGSIGYSEIGSFNGTAINVTYSDTSSLEGNCDRREACAECPQIRDRDLRYAFMKDVAALNTNATTIVGFFDIHKQGVDPYRCGELNMPGFQQLLAFFYGAQQVINTKIQGKVRVLAIDTCSNSLQVDQDLFGLLEGTGICNSAFNIDKPITIDNLGSVITLGDLNTQAAARVLEQTKVTYLSPNALSSYLDGNKYLLRTVAPNKALISSLASLLYKLGWRYLDVLYELNSPYGIYYFKDFNYYARKYGLCEGTTLGLDAGFTADNIKLNGYKGSKVVVLFGSLDFVRNVLTSSSSTIDQYVWVLGGDWTLTPEILKTMIPSGKTATLITVHRVTYAVKSYLTYLNNALKFGVNSTLLPSEWIDEFYQTMFNCTIAKSAKPINIGKPQCLTNRTYTFDSHDKYVLNTIAAVLAAATGLEGVQTGYSTADRRNTIFKNTLKVSENLLTPPGNLVLLNPPVELKLEFDQDMHWWNSGLEIRILKASARSDGSVNVQEVKALNVTSAVSDSQAKDIMSVFNITSTCTDNSGCSCSFESTGKTAPLTGGGFAPTDHRNYYLYNEQGSLMYEWPIWAIVVAIITSLGLLITVVLFLVLLILYPVRRGTSVLGFMVIVGILGIYVINFAFFVNASEATCGSRRFLMGVVYMIAFAPMLIKALDNWRFSQVDEKGVVKDRYSGISSSCSLFCAALGIVLVQCIIPIIWLILVHPTASYWPSAEPRHDNWWCDPPEDYDEGIVLSMVFVMFIVLMTGIFSALTFDSQRNNFESRWMLFGSIATAGCFLVWMIVTTNAGPPFRDAAVSIGNCVNATLLMLMMPFRKSVLLCRSKRGKKDDDSHSSDNGEPISFSNDGYNPGYELNDYDQYNTKPSEF